MKAALLYLCLPVGIVAVLFLAAAYLLPFLRLGLAAAVFRKSVLRYLSNPTGYVFITVFVLLGAWGAFFQSEFFQNNLANLNTLNEFFPYLLLFFVPSITMAVWADERRQGTDELLFTLPGGDFQIVLGKYLSTLLIYTLSLLFALSYVAVLTYLGRPDPGLMFSTYLGYWLLGAALLSIGMVGSALTNSLPVAFILGALFCAVFVIVGKTAAVFSPGVGSVGERLGVFPYLESFAAGLVTVRAIAYHLLLLLAGLYLNYVLVGRRRYDAAVLFHRAARFGFALAGLVAVGVMADRTRLRADVTAEQLHSLVRITRDVIWAIPPERPVYIHAFVSAAVPKEYVQTRLDLLALLREYEAIADGRIILNVKETEKYSDEAREAEQYGIKSRAVMSQEEGGRKEVFLGAAFLSGSEEVVVPFFFKGLSVEYELTRSIRVVSRQKRRKIGILNTDAGLFSGARPWQVVRELQLQYEVVRVSPTSEYPADLSVLVAALPSALTQPEMDRLERYIKRGKPVLVLEDPLPISNPQLISILPPAPSFDRRPQKQRGSIGGILAALGISLPMNRVVWQTYNPHPDLADLEPEFLFLRNRADAKEAFEPTESVGSGLQEMLLLHAGSLSPRPTKDRKLFQPLLRTGTRSGDWRLEPLAMQLLEQIGRGGQWQAMFQRQSLGENLWKAARAGDPEAAAIVRGGYWRGEPRGKDYVLAARIRGKRSDEGQDPWKLNAIVIADLDFISDTFFQLRREKVKNLEFDNVAFVLNCVDVLAGDPSMVDLRKRRQRHRTLERIELQAREFEEARVKEERDAQERAKKRIDEAQARFDAAIREVQNRTDLDEQARRRRLEERRSVEQRYLEETKKRIQDDKGRVIEKSKARMERRTREIHRDIRMFAILLPPVPALLLAIVVFFVRFGRERQSIPKERWVKR